MAAVYTASDAAGYEAMMGRWSRILAQPFLDFANVRSGSRVLDLGCGTGSLSQALLDRVGPSGALLGVDISPHYVEHATLAVTDPRARFVVGDANHLDLPSGNFDASLSLLVLNFVPEYRKAVSEMARVTRSKGIVAAAVWDLFGDFLMLRMFWDTAAMLHPSAKSGRNRGMMAVPLAREGHLAEVFRQTGMENVEERDLLIRMHFAAFDDYWAPFLSGQGTLGAYVMSLDADMRTQFRSALYDAYCAGEPDGPRSFTAVARAVRGNVR